MAEPYVIKMPQLSDTMTEGVVVTWEKNIGDKVERGDIVATVETDKAIMDVEVFREGYLSGPTAAIDTVVPVGGALAYIVESAGEVQGEGAEAPAEAAAPVAETKPAAAELPIPPYHRDVSGGNVAMRRPGPRKRRRKIRKLNRVRIQGIEAHDRAVGVNHDVEADIIRLGELVRGLLEIVVDLLDTARKSRSIMFFGIERLDGVSDLF